MKPVWPVKSTRRPGQKSGSIATGGGYLDAIAQPDASSPPARGAAFPDTAEVLGIPLAVSDYGGDVDWMQSAIADGERGYVTAAAVNLVMSADEDPAVLDAVLGARLVVPDGQPLVWALHALGHARATRVYGPDLMLACCARAAHDATPIFLYGGKSEAALALLEASLRERFPGLRIAGGYSPPFRELDRREEDELVERIDSSGAALVWVGTGQPKQELWMARMRPRLQAPLLVGVGAAFDFHAGLLAQAPGWMQRRGLEWTYRLAREPRRLWRRYARHNPRFVVAFARQLARERRA